MDVENSLTKKLDWRWRRLRSSTSWRAQNALRHGHMKTKAIAECRTFSIEEGEVRGNDGNTIRFGAGVIYRRAVVVGGDLRGGTVEKGG